MGSVIITVCVCVYVCVCVCVFICTNNPLYFFFWFDAITFGSLIVCIIGVTGCNFQIIVWCMKFERALNKVKNTPIIKKDENGLKIKLIITSFNIRLLTLEKV